MEDELRLEPEVQDAPIVMYRAPETDLTEQQRAERLKQLAARLLWLGVDGRTVERLLASYDLDRIERQLDWIGARRARHPAGLIVAAIEADYPAPRNLFGGRYG